MPGHRPSTGMNRDESYGDAAFKGRMILKEMYEDNTYGDESLRQIKKTQREGENLGKILNEGGTYDMYTRYWLCFYSTGGIFLNYLLL
jgi:hypothetical protein